MAHYRKPLAAAVAVAAGLLLSLTGYYFFDPLIAGGIAIWFVVSTGREVFASHNELIWPENIVCGHSSKPATRIHTETQRR
jgi:divalent metal cation (Fe/Co/Zn/Cd) transporter